MGSNLAFSVLTLRAFSNLGHLRSETPIETLQNRPSFLAFLHLRFWDQNSFAESVLELIGMEMEELGRSGGLVFATWGDGGTFRFVRLKGMQLEVSCLLEVSGNNWRGSFQLQMMKVITYRINGINSVVEV